MPPVPGRHTGPLPRYVPEANLKAPSILTAGSPECWQHFREAVQAHLQEGSLQGSIRQQLIRLAGRLGITPFAAGVIMTQIQLGIIQRRSI